MDKREHSKFSYSPDKIGKLSKADVINNAVSECKATELEMSKVSTNFH